MNFQFCIYFKIKSNFIQFITISYLSFKKINNKTMKIINEIIRIIKDFTSKYEFISDECIN